MTLHGLPSADRCRERLRMLLLQFERYGLESEPDFISAPPAELAAVRSARIELLRMMREDQRIRSLEALGEHEVQTLLLEVVRLCVRGRLQAYLSEVDVPYPIYNFFAGFDENADGPWDSAVARPAPFRTPTSSTLMGMPLGYPIGVPASGLTANARWISYFAQRGFNVLTFKTVRSREHGPHAWPHWVFVEDVDPWESLDEVTEVNGDLSVWPKDLARFSTANSFGVPSPAPHVWQEEVERSLMALGDGQLLIVSVMGSADHYHGKELVADFVRVAKLAEATGVRAVELNLSCPNTPPPSPGDPEPDEPDEPEPDEPTDPIVPQAKMAPPICMDPEMSRRIVADVREALRPETRLVAKLGYLPPHILEDVVSGIGPHVDAVSGINTVQATIRDSHGGTTPFIGTADDPEFPRGAAGVSGAAILDLGIDFATRVSKYGNDIGFDVIAMGGVMSIDDVGRYLSVGAAAVQSATGACLYPELAADAALRLPVAAPRKRRRGTAHRLASLVTSGGYSLLGGTEGAR